MLHAARAIGYCTCHVVLLHVASFHAASSRVASFVQPLRRCIRAKVIRKARGVGIISGGAESVAAMPVGHGQEKLKSEALTEAQQRCCLSSAAFPAVAYSTQASGGGARVRGAPCGVRARKVEYPEYLDATRQRPITMSFTAVCAIPSLRAHRGA